MGRFAIVALVLVSGCDGDRGPTGDTGPAGGPGANGTDGTNGTNGNDIILSATAKHGLDIAPVTLDLTGKTGDEIEQIGRGSYIVNAVADCDGCHNAPDGRYLAGGNPFPIGPTNTVYVRNITPDVTGLTLTEDEFIEALRTGKDFRVTGASLIVMPWLVFRWMSTEDLKAIYAYLRVIPPEANGSIPVDVKPTVPPTAMPVIYDETGAVTTARAIPPETDVMGNPIPDPGNLLRGLAVQPFDDPPELATLSASELASYARGSYLVQTQALCAECHTNPARDFFTPPFLLNTDEYLTGGALFDVPPPLQPLIKQRRSMSANLIGSTGGGADGFFVVNGFPEFLGAVETGTYGGLALGFPMPWQHFRNMTIDDLAAVYTFVKTLSVAYPRPNKATQHPARYCTTATAATDCTGSGETCNATTNECVGGTCTDSADCGACQTCSGTCAAPGTSDACLTSGI